MHTTARARLALFALLACLAIVALARRVEPRPPRSPPSAKPSSGQGDRLRDGAAIDLNRATAAELELLPGVGPKLARDIVEARTRAGKFTRIEQLDAVPGIGPKKLAKLRPFLESLEHAADAQRHVGRVQ
jgi:competence protein ComEA